MGQSFMSIAFVIALAVAAFFMSCQPVSHSYGSDADGPIDAVYEQVVDTNLK